VKQLLADRIVCDASEGDFEGIEKVLLSLSIKLQDGMAVASLHRFRDLSYVSLNVS
jgi:hypothetical protein